MNEVEKLKKEYEEIRNELIEVDKRYYDYKRRCWKQGFNAGDWTYCTEFWHKANYREWENDSVVSYINFLTARLHNIKNKINQLKMKNFGRH